MKKIILLATAALLVTGVTFADNGKKGKKSCKKSSCSKSGKSCCKKKADKEDKAEKTDSKTVNM